ncbi:MAG: MucR family transcriptional regulator [Thermodesulfobacteriota bacterium]
MPALQASWAPRLEAQDAFLGRGPVVGLECGMVFKALATRHLHLQNLDQKTYKEKWGLPFDLRLSSQEVMVKKGRALEEARAQQAVHRGKKTPEKS